ncbi:7,8-dihydro-8-oxoguanine-triphosphatase [Shewanella mangrovi]|uniref:8-oxo-dGTP diphosphatase n=1 Tax=Shewanella mangrovi TaxID=1515746 RepID=A0A094JAA0_9GAMM|nr:8-oxo-dGTP diphosphatase MutT [Shewanella mangrovi]KFZ36182.1 7,8-dihydro-8-oxoguanine-triphosphatase [Shewanella mangrovi]
MTKRVHVAVGVILREQQVLLAKRHGHLHQGGKWEFPGGKVEANEDVTAALVRELEEEIGISATETSPFMTLSYDYPEKQVFLDIHLVTAFTGQEQGAEGQEIRWVSFTELPSLAFPDANKPILDKILSDLV